MARLRSLTEKIASIDAMLVISQRARVLERSLIRQGMASWLVAVAVQDVLDEGQTILASLAAATTFRSEPAIIPIDPGNGYSTCTTVIGPAHTFTANGGRPFTGITVADVLIVSNALSDANNGKYTVSAKTDTVIGMNEAPGVAEADNQMIITIQES